VGDPFRDEEHAALIRAAHLEEENAELRAALEAAKNSPKTGGLRADDKSAREGSMRYALFGAGCAFLAVAVLTQYFAGDEEESVAPPEIAIEPLTVPFPVIVPIPPPPMLDWSPETSGTSVDLYAFAQGSRPAVGYAVGSGGTVLRHFAGGSDPWTIESSGTTEDLFGVAENLGAACAVGSKGTVICAHDPASAIWNSEKSGTSKDLFAIAHAGIQGGFLAVGRAGTIVRRDGERAAHWQLEPSGTTADLHATIGGYAVGDHGTILRRDESRWVIEPSGTTEDLYAVESNTNDVVVVGAHGTILRRSDPRGGWKAEESGTESDLFSVTRGDAGYDFIAAGANGVIVRSANRGLPWTRMNGTDRDLRFIVGSIPTMYAVGENGTIVARRY
jgi:photosystem II stability/assembly factor-like uncharacterized protein